MKKFKLTYRPYGEEALLIEWPARIDDEILHDILSFQDLVEEKFEKKIEETLNTYNSLAIFFNSEIISLTELVDSLKKIRKEFSDQAKYDNSSVWEIPVCYDLEFGVDLETISREKNLTEKEVVKIHIENIYTVYFIGFLPGFLYLGGLSEKLFTPRKQTPRPKIIRGSVAIGGSQTGIYPQESPGGWNIIGNCPIPLFDINANTPCKIKAGDRLKFVPISKVEYDVLSKMINTGAFEFKRAKA